MCQCGIFNNIIKKYEWKYRAGLNELIKQGVGTRKGAYYTDLNIRINDSMFKVNLLSMQAGEIKKSTQPSTRKKRLGTGLLLCSWSPSQCSCFVLLQVAFLMVHSFKIWEVIGIFNGD